MSIIFRENCNANGGTADGFLECRADSISVVQFLLVPEDLQTIRFEFMVDKACNISLRIFSPVVDENLLVLRLRSLLHTRYLFSNMKATVVFGRKEK